jgi:PAS domain S-box-containing protein
MPTPEIPFIKLLSEKILPFEGSAAMTVEKERFPDGILILQPDFTVVFANVQAGKILSQQEDNLIGAVIDIEGLSDNTNLIHSLNIDQIHKIIEIRTSPIEISGVIYVLAILQDVTRQFDIINRLNLAIEATQLGLWDHQFKTNTTSINSYYATMLDYTFEEFETGSWINLVHPIDIQNVWDVWNKHIAGEVPFYAVDYRIKTKTDRWKWIRARGLVKDTDENGNPLHFIGSHQDVTEQRQAQRQLQLLYAVTAISNEFSPLITKLENGLRELVTGLFADAGVILRYGGGQDDDHLTVSFVSDQSTGILLDQLPYSLELDLTQSATVIHSSEKGALPHLFAQCNAAVALAYPLKVRGADFGAILILWEKEQPIPDLELEIAAAAINQLSEMIERERLREIARVAEVDRERQRLARELHDSLSQSLYSVLLTADGGQDYAHQGDIEKTREIFASIKSTIQQSLKEMRLLIYELRPSILSNAGLEGALRHRLNTVEKRSGIETSIQYTLDDRLPADLETELFGIAREALNNVLKHSRAGTVSLTVKNQGDKVIMEVADDGIGSDQPVDPALAGFGLASMSERAQKVGGFLSIRSSPDHGTNVHVAIPLPINPDRFKP